MNILKTVSYVMLFSFSLFNAPVYAAEDLFKAHKKAMSKEGKATTTSVYGAWGKNMGNMIKQGMRTGVVVENGASSSKDVIADGVGNIKVEKGARVRGPIINNTDLSNSTVIVR